MEKVKTLYVYNLLNSNGDELRMRLGYVVDANGNPYNVNAAWRWSFDGKKIPMPVRSRTWFCGFPEQTMISWLNGNGWYVRTRVDVMSGYAEVYELPKGNEEQYELSDIAIKQGEGALKDAIKLFCKADNKMKAIMLYRYFHPCNLKNANEAVEKIQHE